MAIAVIGGLISSTALSLVLVPVVYEFVDGFEQWIRPKLSRFVTSKTADDDRPITEGEERTARRLGRAGGCRVALARPQPDALEELAGALDAVAAEPAFELLEPMADEQTADDGPQDRDAECHVP
jgi:hypothetical protein